PAMQWACGAGVITGVTDATLVPQGEATRAQVAAMLMRFCEAIG
ncbi:MAG TPA: S-layer homology domain-containing protein, partial [Candidatus Scatomorpha stercoravium]|nr:S-layer homology domain-containing protein [Candidatus Scatomorpha stercoravium]